MTDIIKRTACTLSHPRLSIPSLPADRPLNGRNSEGDIVELKDGRLMLVYSHYYSNGEDHDPCDIRGKISADGGRSWGDNFMIQENVGTLNVMSASLARMAPLADLGPTSTTLQAENLGPIGLVYLHNNTMFQDDVVFRSSSDEGQRWSQERLIVPHGCYKGICPLNSTLTVLSDGRLIMPLSVHLGGTSWSTAYYSDDSGLHWTRSLSEVWVPAGPKTCSGFGEPSLIELRDGRLMMFGRTSTGRIWKSYSLDRGRKWTIAEPTDLASSQSPSVLKRNPATGDLMLVWNQDSGEEIAMGMARARLSVAISHDDGDTWEHFKNIESLDDRTRIEPVPLGEIGADPNAGIFVRTPGHAARKAPRADFSTYPYAGNSKDYRGYKAARYPSITFLSGDRVAISYGARGGSWNMEGPRADRGEGTWTNESNLPGLQVQVIPLNWFYE